jgi:hypothetical protein
LPHRFGSRRLSPFPELACPALHLFSVGRSVVSSKTWSGVEHVYCSAYREFSYQNSVNIAADSLSLINNRLSLWKYSYSFGSCVQSPVFGLRRLSLFRTMSPQRLLVSVDSALFCMTSSLRTVRFARASSEVHAASSAPHNNHRITSGQRSVNTIQRAYWVKDGLCQASSRWRRASRRRRYSLAKFAIRLISRGFPDVASAASRMMAPTSRLSLND